MKYKDTPWWSPPVDLLHFRQERAAVIVYNWWKLNKVTIFNEIIDGNIHLQTKINNTNLPQKKLSKDTACWPNINWCCILCGTKYEFWSSVVARANVWNICFTIYLCIEKFISIKMKCFSLCYVLNNSPRGKSHAKKEKKCKEKYCSFWAENSEMLETSSALVPTVE